MQIAEKVTSLVGTVVSERGEHYRLHANQVPQRQQVDGLISSYANSSTAIAGGLNLIPGPWGMVAAVPEICLVLRNQMMMVYDIGVAYGKGQALTKELLIGVLLSATGSGAGTLLVVQGGKVLVKRTSLRVLQRIIRRLAGDISQKMLKSMISKWLPVVGAAAMAAWANYSTRQIGRKAIAIFEKEIEYAPDIPDEPDIPEPDPDVGKASVCLDSVRIRALINLAQVDGTVAAQERVHLRTIIDNSDLGGDERAALLGALGSRKPSAVDYQALADTPDDALGLLIDMVALAKRDGEYHRAERAYIKRAARQMGFPDSQTEDALGNA